MDTKQAIKQAIQQQGVEVAEEDTFREYANKIKKISVGGTSIVYKSVRFFDYEGTLLHSYTKDEFLALQSLPPLPFHSGLICQGWNHTLEEAQEYVGKYGALDVGPMFITDDGKTRLYITIEEGQSKSLTVYFQSSSLYSTTVNWGDGERDLIAGQGHLSLSHTYETYGSYIIAFSQVDECQFSLGYIPSYSYSVLGGRESNSAKITKVELGRNIIEISENAFLYCRNMSSITIPQGVQYIRSRAISGDRALRFLSIPDSVTDIGEYAFSGCSSLVSVSLPQGITSIGTYAFNQCYSLPFVSLPNSITSVSSHLFYECKSLSSVVIPQNVTMIDSYAFAYCSSLKSVDVPYGVEGIRERTFYECSSLASVSIPQSVASIASYAFYKCVSLYSLSLPDSISILSDNAFNDCKSLIGIEIPPLVTNIPQSAFVNCTSMTYVVLHEGLEIISASAFAGTRPFSSVRIPSTVHTIGSNAFAWVSEIYFYDFSNHTAVPALGESVFSGVKQDCKIIVPDALYDEWIAATNWSVHSSKIIKKTDWDASQS